MASESLTPSLRETLATFDGGGEPRTTTEVAEALDLGRRSTYDRLDRLVDAGRLESKKVGSKARVWWRPPDGPGGDADRPPAAASLVDDVLDDVEVSVFVLDEDLDVAWVNAATERYFGLDRDEVLGRDKRSLVLEEIRPKVADGEAFAETVLATYRDGAGAERFECRVTGGDGREERWLEHRSKPIESGAYAGGRVELYYDVTDRRRTEEATRTDREEFQSLVEAVDEYAIFTLDEEGYVRTWNPGAARIKGYDADEIVGEHFSRFYTESDREARVPERNLAAAARDGSTEDEGWRVRADGSRFWANVTITAIRDDDGEIRGYAKVTRDMTDRREHEEHLREERNLLRRVVDAVPVGIGFVSPDGTFTRANARVEERPGTDELDAGGYFAGARDLYDEDGEYVPVEERPYMRVFETGEPVEDWRCQVDLPGYGRRWLSVHAVPLTDDGGDVEEVVVVGDDVTQLKEQAARLQRRRDELETELEEVFERVDDAFYALDDEWRFTHVNDRAADLFGVDPGALVGRNVWEVLDVPDDAPIREEFLTAMATQESTTFEQYSESLGIWELVRAYPSESGLSVYFRDVTERKERERELEESRRRYRTLVENFPNGAVALVDEDLRYVTFGGALSGDFEASSENIEGTRLPESLPSEIVEVVRPGYEAALRGEPTEFEATVDDRHYQYQFVPVRDDDGEVFAALGMSQDITERKEYERSLRDAKSRLEAATEAGAVGTWEWRVPEDEMVGGPSFAKMFAVDPDVTREGVSLDNFIEAIHEDDRERVEREIEAALESCGEYECEYRVWDADGDLRWVVARGHVECDDDGNPVTFPGALTDITERKRTERELERRRQQLEALNNLSEVAREITSAVIEQSTREEIEATVCERLADSDSYSFAWIGDVDATSQTVTVRTEAGAGEYLDGIRISVDPDDEHSRGPTGQALLTGETQVVSDVRHDDRHEPWRDRVDARDFRSSAAIPVSHDGTVYGALNVYSERPYAFESREREVVEQLGEIVGHAIAAAERKRALMSDELVELEFQIQDVFGSLDVPVDTDGRISLDDTVPLSDGEFLVYGTAAPDAVDTVDGLVDHVPHWESVSVRSDGDPVEFELTLSDPPVLSTVASLGGYVDDAVIEGGDYRMTIHLAPTVDVRTVIDAVQEAYPDAEMLRRRQITRSDDDPRTLKHELTADLTDRQRTALEAAYHAGFFEWPRDASGEDVADSIGVAAPTFHQHLRKAERKVFDAVLSTSG